MSLSDFTRADEVEHLLRNAQLRDALEPLFDESIGCVNAEVMSTSSENEFLESMLEWERAPIKPIYQWFAPGVGLPNPETLDDSPIARRAARHDCPAVRKKYRARLYRAPLRPAAVLPDLSRHPAVVREVNRTSQELSALGLRQHGRRPRNLAPLLRQRGRTPSVGGRNRWLSAADRGSAVSTPAAAGPAVARIIAAKYVVAMSILKHDWPRMMRGAKII